jgi:energy-coupling factor transporter ATP-binding protein EcfA2
VKNICKEYPFLQAGELTLPGLDKISKELKKNRFFVNQNRLYLNGDLLIEDAKTLDNTIKEITDRINRVDELKKLSKYLSDVKGMTLRRLLETHHNIVPYLTKNKIDELRILLWKSYFTELKDDFQSLKEEYEQVRKLLQKGNFKQSPWEHALMIFNERFSVPFEMRIANYESAVLGESLPRVEFYFRKDNADLQDSSCDIAISRDRLEELGTLSQGERRALYLLNIIFDIEQRNLAKQKTLYIIDDIADSFDYKNKYAIIEYLLDLKNNPLNHLIVLSHNFDFYRTVASRLNLVRKNRLIALLTDQDEIQLQEEKYQKHPFTPWRNHTESPDNFIALIPFVRNLIEYGYDYRILEDKFLRSDSDVLTSLLHIKSITRDITVKDVAKLYEFYLFGIDSNTAGIGEKVKIDKYEDNTLLIDLIQKQAKEVGPNDTQLEYKIILSIAIRLITEEFIINKINENEDFKEPTSNQTRYLLDKMRKLYPGLRKEILRIFDAVNIVTPEQIHFNSFMYEPLVDMDILELLQLYQAVNKLDELWEENNE